MKKFLIDYRPSLGEYLDEEGIGWETDANKYGNQKVYIYCQDINDLFRIACGYQRWFLAHISSNY